MYMNRLPAKIAMLAGVGALGVIAASVAPARETASAATVGAAPAQPARAEGALHYVLAATGNEARYFVREQLAGVSFPNDAIGVTSAMTGGIVVDSSGHIVSDESKIVVDVTGLKSDRDRRDGYVQRRTLETERFPTVELVPKEVRGLPSPLPAEGKATFELSGDLTIKGVTRPTTWQVAARFRDNAIVGTASTGFTFDDFEMTKPSVSILLSVADSIHLQYDFKLIPATATTAGS